MKHTFTTPTRAEVLAVACPICGAVSGEACRRPDAKMHEPRIALARSVLSQRRKAVRDAKTKRVAQDWLKP